MDEKIGGNRLTFSMMLILAICICIVFVPVNHDKTEIAVVMPFSGELGEFGTECMYGVMMAEDDLSDDDMHITYYDSSSATIPELFETIKAKGTSVVIGSISSSESIELAELSKNEGIIVVNPVSTASELTKYNHVLRMVSSDNYRANGIMRLMNTNGIESLTVVYDSNDKYSTSMAESVERSAESYLWVNLTVVSITDENYLEKIRETKSEAIFCTLSSPSAFSDLKTECEEASIRAVWIGDDSILCDEIAEITKTGSVYCFTFNRSLSNPGFLETYRSEYDVGDGTIAAYGYDTLTIVHSALRTDGKEYATLLHNLKETRSLGKTGSISFDEHGDRYPSFSLYMCEDGEWKRLSWSQLLRMSADDDYDFLEEESVTVSS